MSKRIRLDDVVKKTGLSRSTVDRVLNNRSGVRAETRKIVEGALSEMGYAPNALTSRLLMESRTVEILLSEGSNPFFSGIRYGFDRAVESLDQSNVQTNILGFDPYEPSTLLKLLDKIGPETSAVIAVGVETPEAIRAVNRIEAMGVRVITAISDVLGSNRTAFVGQDNFIAGRTAGRLMQESIGDEPGTVAAVIGHLQFRHLLDRRSGFEQIIGMKRPDIRVISPRAYGSDPRVSFEIAETLKSNYPDLKGIYICGGGQPSLVEAFTSTFDEMPVVIGHEVNDVTRSALDRGLFRFVVAHDVEEIGRKALEAALAVEPPKGHVCGINIYVADNLPLH